MNQKKFHTLNEVLLSFDSIERKGFYDYEVVEAINELPEDIRNSCDAQYEILAFSFSENAEKYWGTFYGPEVTWKRKDTGEDGRNYVVLDMNYEPYKGDNGLLVRMVNDFPSGEYTIEAGFILKENRQDKYPEFYRQTFAFKK